MAQTVPAAADLGPAYTGLAIGYRVLNLDETEYSAFSTTGVAETSIVGFYRKDNGVSAPDAGGYIIWGVSGTDYAEATIAPAAPTAAQINAEVDTALADYDAPTKTELDAAQASIESDIAGLNDLDSTAIQTAAAAALTAYDPPTKTELDSAVAPLATSSALATAAGYIDTEVAAIKAKTDNLPASPASTGDITSAVAPLATAADLTTVASYLDTEIVAILADTNELQTDWANGGRLDSILDARSSQASVDTIDGIVDSILVDTGAIETAVGALNDLDATEVQAATAAALNAYDGPTKAELDSAVAPLATQASVDTIDGIVDAILVDTGTDGVVVAAASKTGYALSAAGVQAIWDALTSALTTVGSIGKRLSDNVDVAISSRMATFTYTTPPTVEAVRIEMDSNSTKLANLDATVSSRSTYAGGAVASVTGNVGGNVTGSVGSLATQARADVNAEADQALADAGVTTTVTGRIDAAISSRSTLTAQQVWEYGTRTLTAFGTLAADVWAVAIRTITGGSLTTAPPTAAEIDTQLSGTHGNGGWSTATGFATPANVTDAQTAILEAIATMPDAAAMIAAIMAYSVETGVSLDVVMKALLAVIRGDSATDDPQNPTWNEYYAPDGTTVRVRHEFPTDTTRVNA